MKIYTFDIFTNHFIDETNRIGFHMHHLEIGTLYLPEPSNLKLLKKLSGTLYHFPYLHIWFSSWEDFFWLLQTGTKLPIRSVVLEVNRILARVERGICTIDHMSENGDISFDLHEDFPTLMKGYQITAKRNWLRTLN